MSKAQEALDLFRQASEQLAEARVRYSQEWQLARAKASSDMMATQVAIEKTQDEITHRAAALIAAQLTYELTLLGRRDKP